MKMFGEYLPTDWRALESSIDDPDAFVRALHTLSYTLDHAKPDGGAITDEINSIAYRLSRIGFWDRLTPLQLSLIFYNRPHDLTEIFQNHIERRFT